MHQRQNRGVDGVGIDQRFIALNVDDNFSSIGRRGFGDAIRSG